MAAARLARSASRRHLSPLRARPGGAAAAPLPTQGRPPPALGHRPAAPREPCVSPPSLRAGLLEEAAGAFTKINGFINSPRGIDALK